MIEYQIVTLHSSESCMLGSVHVHQTIEAVRHHYPVLLMRDYPMYYRKFKMRN